MYFLKTTSSHLDFVCLEVGVAGESPLTRTECIVRNRIVPGGFAVCGLSTLWPGSWGLVFRDCKSSWNRQVKDGRAGNSCPQFSPYASTNKEPHWSCEMHLAAYLGCFCLLKWQWTLVLLVFAGLGRQCRMVLPLPPLCPRVSWLMQDCEISWCPSQLILTLQGQSNAGNSLSLPRTIQTGICMWEEIVICSP